MSDPTPSTEAPDGAPLAWLSGNPPDHEMPASVAFDAMLAEADGYALFCSGLQVFSRGFRLQLELRARRGRRTDRIYHALHEGGPDQVLVGVEFSDGRRGRNHGRGHRSGGDPDAVRVWGMGGGGSSGSADLELFIAPLPPPGPARIVCAWPARGIRDTVTELPVEAILEAAGRVRELWPPQPFRDDEPLPPPEPPPVPADSWFAG